MDTITTYKARYHNERILKTIVRLVKSGGKIFDNEKESIKILEDYFTQETNKQLYGQDLFLKLCISYINEDIKKHGQINASVKKLNTELSKDYNYLLEELKNNINMFQTLNVVNFENDQQIRELTDDRIKEIQDIISKDWTIDKVEKSLKRTALSLLQDIEKYK